MKNLVIRALPVAALMTAGLAAPATAEVIDGTDGPDVLIGTAQADTIRGYAGNDVVRGRGAADHLYGGTGADRLYGGKDLKPDVLYGSAGNDHFYVRGRDTVYAGAGNDVIHGLPYQSMLVVKVHCGPGYDRVVGLNPWLIGLGGPDTDCEVYPGN
jgi:Ca2+-binding RTX toxin-like protein